jgi:hypothetical protein
MQTSAARVSRLSAIPFEMAASVFIEQGTTAMASTGQVPLAGGAMMSSSK